MSNTYSTSQIAKIVGVHPNTVRLYESLELIPPAIRKNNGYRVFNDYHIEQFKLAKMALKVDVLQNGLRKKAIMIIKLSAKFNIYEALMLAKEYLTKLRDEQENAEEAIAIVNDILKNKETPPNIKTLTRKQTAEYLNISIDTLRNWELNGLIKIKRSQNGYRVYTYEDILTLKVIRSLRCANYSLSAILRMLSAFSDNPDINIREVINTPNYNEEIVSVCDKLISSLKEAEFYAIQIISQLEKMLSYLQYQVL